MYFPTNAKLDWLMIPQTDAPLKMHQNPQRIPINFLLLDGAFNFRNQKSETASWHQEWFGNLL